MRAIIPTLLALAAGAGSAAADVVPPREYVLARHGELIVAKGLPCPKVTASDPVEGYPDLRAAGLSPNLVVCSDGSRYVLATPARRRSGPVADPAGTPPQPPAEPVVRRLD